MTRSSENSNQQVELLLNNKILAAIKKSITKIGKESIEFERIQEENHFEDSPNSSTSINEKQTLSESKQIQYVFKKPIDKFKVRKINNLAQELG